jgi:outer membrane protein assembly factor BamB
MYALDADSGAPRWTFDTPGPNRSSPTVQAGTLFFGSDYQYSGKQKIYEVDAETGDRQWAAAPIGYTKSSPTVVGDTVFVGGAPGVYGFDVASGELQWTFENERYAYKSSPTVADGTLFIGRGTGVYALDTGLNGSSEGTRVMLETLGHH